MASAASAQGTKAGGTSLPKCDVAGGVPGQEDVEDEAQEAGTGNNKAVLGCEEEETGFGVVDVDCWIV